MKRDDVLNVNQAREDLYGAFDEFSRSMRTIFGDVVHALDTVIDRYNAMDTRLASVEQEYGALGVDHAALAQRFETVSARLLAIETRLGGPQ